MNLTNFVQTGGFPVKAERLQELQTAYSIFNELGNLAGNLTIISGCNTVGTSVSDGYVFINGEVLPFKAGFVSANVIIIQEESSKEFENGEVKPVHYERYVTFGTNPDASWSWASFKRPDPILTLMSRMATLEKKAAVFQAGGGMVLWNKPLADIPTGWTEVVNWRGRMPIGLDTSQTEFDTLGEVGGAKKVKLNAANIPELDVTIKRSTNTSGGSADNFVCNVANNAGTGTLKANASSANTDVNIMNPYRVVLFIEYIG